MLHYDCCDAFSCQGVKGRVRYGSAFFGFFYKWVASHESPGLLILYVTWTGRIHISSMRAPVVEPLLSVLATELSPSFRNYAI
jgi:hypothetical protein